MGEYPTDRLGKQSPNCVKALTELTEKYRIHQAKVEVSLDPETVVLKKKVFHMSVVIVGTS